MPRRGQQYCLLAKQTVISHLFMGVINVYDDALNRPLVYTVQFLHALRWQLDRSGPVLDYASVCVCLSVCIYVDNNNVGNH